MDGWIDRSEVVGGGDGDGDHVVPFAAADGNILAGSGTFLLGLSEPFPSKRGTGRKPELSDGIV